MHNIDIRTTCKMKAKAERSAVLYVNDCHLTLPWLTLEGGVEQRKDLRTVTDIDNIQFILAFINFIDHYFI